MEEKDLNYFINRASGLNQVDADNYFQTRGVQGEDYSFAMNTLAEKNPDFFGKKQKVKAPLINNANAVFSDDDNWWDKIAGSFAQGIDVSKENKRMSSLVNEGALGMEADDEEVRAFAESIDSVNSMELTPELQRYNELLAEKEALREDDDDGLFSEIIDSTRAIMDSWDEDGEMNFGLIPQIFSQSMGAYATTENILTVVGSTVAGAVAGAVTTSPTVVGMPVGLLAGAYSGFRLGSSIVGGIVEAQSATAELVMEQLEMRGLEYNETNLKTILNDDDAMFEVVKKGAARGLTIGAIEFITQGLAGKGVGVAKKAVGRGRAGNLAGVATAIGVEAVGGGVGEIAGSAAAGQDITGSDVVMESIGGTATAPFSIAKGLISAPKYTQRGREISGSMAQRLVDTATPEQLADMGLEIKNDPELSNTLDLRRSPVVARRKAIAANSDLLNRLSEKDGDNLIDLTIELEEQRKSKSPLGKKRVTELEAQIEEIVNNAPKEPETPDVSAEDSSGSEASAPAKNTSSKKVADNNSKPIAAQNSEGERLSQYDESQDGLDGDIEDSASRSGYYTRRIEQGKSKINSLNKRISAILTKVQNSLAPDGGVGGPTALNEEQRQEYQSLLKERNSLEDQLSKDRASERAAKKSSKPTISIDAEEKSNFVEVDSQNPSAGLSDPNMPTEFRSLLSNVLNKAVAKFRDKLPQVSIKVHRDIGSFNIAMREADGSVMSKDNVTFGWYDSKAKQIHMIDVTNPEVRKAIKGFGDFNIDSVTDLVTEEVLFHFAMESVLSDSNVRSSFLNQLLDLALNNYRLRGVLSDRMFSYFPGGIKGMVKAAEGMPKLIRSIENVYIRNGEFTVGDIKALLSLVTDGKKKAKIEEELIGGYVRDYIKSPDAYRNVWQKIADIINRLIGKNIINSEADLKGFARVLSRGIEGEEVQFTPGESQSGSPISKSTRSKREFTYLKDTEVFYTFDRQSGRESDFVATNSRGNYGVPQSIKVNDFFHFRNWYNKITANQEYPGIATEMYFIKDGKKHIVKPPKPQVDKNGKKVRIKRIPTFKELKGAARMRDQAIDSEVRVQYSELSKEVSDLWYESGLNVYTTLNNFYPDGEPSTELDFEGLVIAKKNIQAAIDSGITKEQLKNLRGNRSSVSKEDNPDLFNMSGLSRVSSPEEHGTVHHLESRGLSFSKPTPRKSLPSKEGRKRISLKDLPVNGISLKYDVGATTEYTLKYGDNEYKFKTSGGVSEIAEYEGEGLSASHSTVDQRRTTLKMLKYFEVVLNDDLEDIESYLREPIEAKKKAIDNVKAKKKGGRLNTEEKKLIKNYEKEIKNFEDSIPSQIEEAKALKESLKNDKGLVTLYIHLNDPKSIVGRPQIFKDLGSLLFRAVETEDSIEFTDRLLKDISASIEAVPEAKKAFVGLYGQSALANPSLEVMEEFFKNENDDLAFQGRIDLILRLPMFKSKGDRGSRDKIYNGFPSLKNDLWRQVTDDYYWDNLNEFFVIDRESTSGYALNAMTVDLNKLFSGVNRSAIVKNKGTDFGYYIGGLDTVYDLDSIVSLDKSKSKDGKKEAAKDTYISRIEFEEVSSKKILRLKKELKNADPSKAQTIKSLKSQIKRLEEAVAVTATATKRYGTPKSKESALYRDISKAIGKGYRDGEISYSKASGRVSKQVVEKSGVKGVSVNQLMQIAGKGSKAEQLVISDLIEKFPDSDFIPKEEFDMFFDGKMLEPLDDSKNHSDYGLERVLGSSYRKAKSVTVPFLGDSEIYGTPGIFEDHFRFPTHAHIRMFTHPDNPGVTYVSELQSDTYQRGLKDAFNDDLTDDIIVSDYGSDEFDISVENLDLLKYIVDNYSQYRSMLVDAAGSSQEARFPKFWSDISESIESVSEKNLTKKPNVANILSNALENNPEFNVNAFRVMLRQYATSELNAPINSTDKQIEAVIDDTFNRYPFIQEGEDTNLGRFAKDVSITIDHISDTISDIVLGDDIESMDQEERAEAYGRVVEAVEENRSKVNRDIKEGVSSAKNSWEKQLVRYAIKKAQGDGSRVVRFPTEGTAATIQWWSEGEDALADQVPLRKRYRDLPKTLKSMGLDVKIEKDQRDNSWYEIETPASDTRLVMFSRQTRSNVGNVGGATWTQREQSSTDQFTDKWLVRLQDKYRRVFKLQEDVAKKNQGQIKETEDFRMAEERMYGRAANDLEILDNQTTKITEQLKEEGLSVSDVDEYMYALHAKERNAVISERTEGENTEGSGKSDEWADGILNSLSDEKKAKLEKVASTVREIQQDTRDKMVELGLETQETIDAFEEMFSDYVPLQGQAKDEDSIEFSPYPSGGAGFSVSGATTKKAKGRKTESADIVAQVISQNAAVSIKGRTNESMNALYNLVESNPNEDVWTILDKDKDGYKDLDPNIVSVRVNGVQKAIRFKDGSYAQSLRSMNLPQKNLFVKYMGTLNSWLRAAFTSRNPEFILSNFSRDIQSAIFNASAETDIEGGFLNGTGAMRRIFKMVSPSLKALIRDEVGAKADPLIIRYYNEFKEDGGKTGWAYQKSLEDIASELEIDDSGKTKSQGIVGGVKKGLEFIEGMNDAFENSIRLSAYIAAREGGVSRGKAAQFSKNITVNFNKQGEWGPAMNATFLFFNASIQGTARLGRSLTKLKPAVAPDGSTRNWRQRATNAQKAALGMVIMNGMLTLLNRAASDEDEDEVLFFNKIPDYVKERNMIIMRPDGENYWKIPMPYGYNIFANAGSVAVEVASGDKPALEGLAFMASTMINAFSPVSFGQSENLARMATKSAIPTAFKPFFDAFAFNETYFGSPVMAEQYPFGTPKPNSSMSFRSPEELKQFFSWMNEATGGSENVPGVVDINPDGGWYIMEYFMGGTGKFVERSIETARKTISDTTEEPVKLDFNDVPFMRIVYGEPSKYYDMQKFKDREVEVKQLMSELKGNRVKGDPDRYKGVANLNAKLKAINKQLRNVRSQKRAVRKISNYGERVSKVQALMEKERKLIMMFNKQYDKLRGED